MATAQEKIKTLEAAVAALTAKLEIAVATQVTTVVVVNKQRQQDEALELLFKHPVIKSATFAKMLGLSIKHLQSLMTYCRNDGWNVTKGGEYSLLINEHFITQVAAKKRVLEQFMQYRLDEYNMLKELHAKHAELAAAARAAETA